MKEIGLGLTAAVIFAGFMIGTQPAQAGDLDDGISSFTEGSISADDDLGSKDTNVNFIVTDAIAKAKVVQHQSEVKSADSAQNKGNRINLNNDKEYNENSIVLAPGSKADKVYNIILK